MTEGSYGESLPLSSKELISLYLVLSEKEDALDDTQRSVLARVSTLVYGQLSVEQVERIESYYESL